MDGFGGYKTAATDQLPEAATMMDPFHVVALADTKLDLCRQRVQQQTCGHRGSTGDPLYRVRRILRIRLPLLSTRQQARLTAVFADDNHISVVVTWSVYQRIIAAYCQPDRRRGRTVLAAIIPPARRAHRPGGTGPTWPHPAPAPPRRTGLLRPSRLQRPHRSYQRPPGSPVGFPSYRRDIAMKEVIGDGTAKFRS